jgi:branched-chain amino acid transport system permease protein
VSSICILLIILLINSSYGRAFKSIRDDEIASEAMGISLSKHKMLAFVISSFFAGMGGALFAMYVANAQAKAFTSVMTYEILLIVVVGGIGSISGSVIATFLYVACSEWWLRFLDSEMVLSSGFKVPLLRNGFRMVVFSVVIMVIVLFFSRVIMGDRELRLPGISARPVRPKSAGKGKAAANAAAQTVTDEKSSDEQEG